MEPPHAIRRHDLDALRAFAMLSGVALHSAMSLSFHPWMVRDSDRGDAFTHLISLVHGFRMPLFFLLSGFFTAMLWRQRGLRALIEHRFRRVFLPLLIASVTVLPAVPLVMCAGGMAGVSARLARAAVGVPDLGTACMIGDLVAVKKRIGEGADINAHDQLLGITPLSIAAMYGRDDVVRELLARGADVRARNVDNATALHGAAFLGRAGIVRELLRAGVDPALKNESGERAVDGTTGDVRLTLWIAHVLRVPVEEAALQKGRAEARLSLDASEDAAKSDLLAGKWMFLTRFPFFSHLWFLWMLCWMVAGFALWAWVSDRFAVTLALDRWVASPWCLLWLVPLTMVPAWFMTGTLLPFGPDTGPSLLPPPHLLTYYGIFFGFGALCYGRSENKNLGSGWWWSLPLALALVYPLAIRMLGEGGAVQRGLTVLLQVLYAWLMCGAMTGLFRVLIPAEREWVRYLSDASYWIYLAHLPLVMAAQFWIRDWPLDAAWKFMLVCAGVTAVLLVIYEYGVRYTWIGALLNGRKYRPSAATRT